MEALQYKTLSINDLSNTEPIVFPCTSTKTVILIYLLLTLGVK